MRKIDHRIILKSFVYLLCLKRYPLTYASSEFLRRMGTLHGFLPFLACLFKSKAVVVTLTWALASHLKVLRQSVLCSGQAILCGDRSCFFYRFMETVLSSCLLLWMTQLFPNGVYSLKAKKCAYWSKCFLLRVETHGEGWQK